MKIIPENEAIQRYLAGESALAIGKSYGVCDTRIRALVIKRGITPRSFSRIPKSDWPVICRRYANGESMKEIGESYGYTWAPISDILKRLQKKSRWGRVYHNIGTIKTRFLMGASPKELAEEYDTWPGVITRALKEAGVPARTQEYYHSKGIWHEAFSEINEASAYWIGFLMADGCNHGNSNITLGLSIKDLNHVEKFKQFVRCGRKITIRTAKAGNGKVYQGASLLIRSKKIQQAIEAHGVVPRKTTCAEIISDLKNDRHFWRGMVDGDGCLSHADGRPNISLCGTERIVSQFVEYCKPIIDKQLTISFSNNIYYCRVQGELAVRIANNLYQDCTIALERKEIIAKSWMVPGRLNRKINRNSKRFTPLAITEKIATLRRQGLSLVEIERQVGTCRPTVKKYADLVTI